VAARTPHEQEWISIPNWETIRAVAERVKRVLIVEDAEEICSSMADLLRSEGYDVSIASNGREAMQHLESVAEVPDVILLDLMMPEMDGYEFRALQRADPRLSSIPVLLMTAGGDIQAKAAQLGVRGYLRKPFRDIQTILETIGGALH
jgi:CheY-like chemotaxis protein